MIQYHESIIKAKNELRSSIKAFARRLRDEYGPLPIPKESAVVSEHDGYEATKAEDVMAQIREASRVSTTPKGGDKNKHTPKMSCADAGCVDCRKWAMEGISIFRDCKSVAEKASEAGYIKLLLEAVKMMEMVQSKLEQFKNT